MALTSRRPAEAARGLQMRDLTLAATLPWCEAFVSANRVARRETVVVVMAKFPNTPVSWLHAKAAIRSRLMPKKTTWPT
eukprot:scaffold36451_cov38-Prasinocladus_malaysianus.AAC.1